MSISPSELSPEVIEQIEKATLRFVVQAVYDYRFEAMTIVEAETDDIANVGEDITREALDKMGLSRIDVRLFGRVDYKKARYVFHPEYMVRQALFVDSKTESVEGRATATIQTSQTSMRIRLVRNKVPVDVEGGLPTVIVRDGIEYLTTTILIKYNYEEVKPTGRRRLQSVTIAAIPNGKLQDKYNPDANDTIWLVGRNAPSRGEPFRARLSFGRLKKKAKWRVQEIKPHPEESFTWEE